MPAPVKKKTVPTLPPSVLSTDDFGKDLVNWLFPAYVTLIVIAIFLFQAPGMMPQGNTLNFDRSVLTAVNAATLTGFPQSVGPGYFRTSGQILVLLLTIAGSLFSLIVGGLAMRRILRLRFTDRQVIQTAAACQAAALLLGAAGMCGIRHSALGSLSQGASAFGNSGMAMGKPFSVTAWQTHLFVLPIIFCGGIGITVLMEIADLMLHGRRLSTHSRTVLTWSLGLYMIAVAGLTFIQWIAAGGYTVQEKFSQSLASSSVLAINSRTAGIPFEYMSVYPHAMHWAVMVLMMIGAASGGTGGGLKVSTLAVLSSGTRKLLRGESPGRPMGIALIWLAIYLGIALFGLLMMLFAEPQLASEQSLFLTISALSNVGLSHDLLPNMPKGTFILAALMMAGRMVPLLILWWMADTTTDAEVAVG